MKKTTVIFIGLALFLICFACKPVLTPSDFPLTIEADGKTVEIDTNTEIVIELTSNPSSGYHWVFSNPLGNTISQIGGPVYTEDPDCSGMDGCGGTETFTFLSGPSAGTGLIILHYQRSEDDISDSFELNVIVN